MSQHGQTPGRLHRHPRGRAHSSPPGCPGLPGVRTPEGHGTPPVAPRSALASARHAGVPGGGAQKCPRRSTATVRRQAPPLGCTDSVPTGRPVPRPHPTPGGPRGRVWSWPPALCPTPTPNSRTGSPARSGEGQHGRVAATWRRPRRALPRRGRGGLAASSPHHGHSPAHTPDPGSVNSPMGHLEPGSHLWGPRGFPVSPGRSPSEL